MLIVWVYMNSKAIYIGIALMLALGGCISEKEEPEWCLQPGETLPDFEVVTLNGERIGSADSYLATLEIVFFNTTCVDCQRELPGIQRQYMENLKLPESERNIFICISREEGASEVARYWQENGLTMPVSAQDDRSVYSLFASRGIPRIFKAKNGKIIESIE